MLHITFKIASCRNMNIRKKSESFKGVVLTKYKGKKAFQIVSFHILKIDVKSCQCERQKDLKSTTKP